MMLSSASSLLLRLFVAIPWRPVNSLGYFDTETCSAHPDPHMKSWHGIRYDYHHGCDVVFVKTDDIEIHLRLAKNQPVPNTYSLIERIGIRFELPNGSNEVLEMDSNGDHFHNAMTTPNPALATIGGYLFTKTSGAQTQYMIDLSFGQSLSHFINIVARGSSGLGISIKGHGTMFFDATGMCGQWNLGPNLNDRNGFDMVPILPGGAWQGGLHGAPFGDAWQVDPSHPSFDPEIISDVTFNPIANGLHAAHPNTCVARRRLEQQPDRELEVSLSCTFCDSMPNLGQRQNCIFDAGILGCNWVQSVPYYDTKDTVWYNEEDNKKDYYPCLQEADPDSVCSRVGKCTQWCDTKNFFCETCLGCNNDVDYNGEMLYDRYLKGCSCQIPMEVPVSTPSCPDGQAYLQIEVQGDEKSRGKNSYVLDVFYKAKKKWKKVAQKKKTLANEFHLYGNCHDVNKCYRFTIVDKKGNGICCESGYGYYKLNFDGQEIMELFEDGETQESSIGNCQGCVDPPEKKFKLPDGTALLCTQLLDGGFKKAICKKYPDSIKECCESCPPADASASPSVASSASPTKPCTDVPDYRFTIPCVEGSPFCQEFGCADIITFPGLRDKVCAFANAPNALACCESCNAPNPKTLLEKFYAEEVFQSKKATCETYRMSEYSKNYQTSQIDCPSCSKEWGLHALQWKGYVHNTATGGSYDAVRAKTLGAPTLYNWPQHVKCGAENDLDTLETSASQLYTDGSPFNYVDPGGGWNCVTEPDSTVGAVTAALNMYHWKTPTYLDARNYMHIPSRGLWYCAIAVIEEVTLCTNTANTPHEDCGWDNVDWTTGLGTITTCAGMVALDDMKVGCFVDLFAYGFSPHRTVNGVDWVNHYGLDPVFWGIPTDLVFDPPVGTSSESLEKLQKMAKATTENMILVRKGKEIEIIQAADPDHVATKDCEWKKFDNSRLFEAASSSGIRGGRGKICFISDERKTKSKCNFLVKAWDTNEETWVPNDKSDDKFNGRYDCSEEEQKIRNPEGAFKYLLSYVQSGLCGCQS